MTPDENKALIQRFYAEIDAGSIDAMDEIVAEGYMDHNRRRFRDWRQDARSRIFWEATPGGRHQIADQIAEGTWS